MLLEIRRTLDEYFELNHLNKIIQLRYTKQRFIYETMVVVCRASKLKILLICFLKDHK